MSSLQDTVLLTDAAEAFLNAVPFSDTRRVIILAALSVVDERREVIVRIGDIVSAYEAYMSRLASGHEEVWSALTTLYERDNEDEDEGECVPDAFHPRRHVQGTGVGDRRRVLMGKRYIVWGENPTMYSDLDKAKAAAEKIRERTGAIVAITEEVVCDD